LSDFKEIWILRTDFQKIIKYQIPRKSVRGNRVVPCGQTDGRTDRGTNRQTHYEANSRFSQFRERAKQLILQNWPEGVV